MKVPAALARRRSLALLLGRAERSAPRVERSASSPRGAAPAARRDGCDRSFFACALSRRRLRRRLRARRMPRQTQLLGLALGRALAFLAAALGVHREAARADGGDRRGVSASRRTRASRRRSPSSSRRAAIALTRRRLLTLAAGGAGCALGAALVAPGRSRSGPCSTSARCTGRRGDAGAGSSTRAAGRCAPTRSSEAFYTAYPGRRRSRAARRAPRRRAARPVGARPAARTARGWAPDGILAFSKICTHAGCAVALYRTPLFEPTRRARRSSARATTRRSIRRPAARVLFGPAGRPLPQLPLEHRPAAACSGRPAASRARSARRGGA